MNEDDKRWLMQRIESLTSEPSIANFGIDLSRCDLEIIIRVAGKDRKAFTDQVLEELKQELAVRTDVLSPVIYLEGNAPEWLTKGEYIH